jgi:hypothetical protein
MIRHKFFVYALFAATTAFGATTAASHAGGVDTYSGGAAIAYLPEEFVLGGANTLGANYEFPGNPFLPVVNGSPVPLYDPSGSVSIFGMEVTSTFNESDGSYSVAMEVFTQDGSPFVTDSTPLVVQTAGGPENGTDFVIDLGNGYQVPGFPVDGVDVGSLPGNVFVNVEYWFERLDGTQNIEFGETTGPFLREEGFTFGWGYDLYLDQPDNPDNPRNIKRAGFIATFQPILPSCPCIGDLNGDCMVNGADLGLMLGAWGSCGKKGPGCFGDLNDDGMVNGADLGLLLGNWGCDG